MKTLTQKEILDLIKAKKLPPSVLKPYQEEEPKKEVSKDDLIVQALCEIRNALTEANIKQTVDNSEILKGIGDKIEALTKAVKDKPVIKPVQWDYVPEYDAEGRIEIIHQRLVAGRV